VALSICHGDYLTCDVQQGAFSTYPYGDSYFCSEAVSYGRSSLLGDLGDEGKSFETTDSTMGLPILTVINREAILFHGDYMAAWN
jgi:hypothetical protein